MTNCLLTKSVKVVKDKDGKEKTFTNFYLVFENGEILPVELKNYSTSDTKKKDSLDKINYANWVKLNTLAHLVKDEK